MKKLIPEKLHQLQCQAIHMYMLKPIIGVLSTGNELQNIGENFSKYKIISGNNLMISSIISVYGGFPKLLPIAPDNINKIEKILNANLDCDFFVSTGGASVGKYDYLHEILNKKSKHTFVDFGRLLCDQETFNFWQI